MGKVTLDQCNMCDEVLVTKESGLSIKGSDIITAWAGGNESNPSDPFANSGLHAPMQGQVSLTICKKCLIDYLRL